LDLAVKYHVHLASMHNFCFNEDKYKICIWDRGPIDVLGKCQKTAYIEHDMFLRFHLLPALKQTGISHGTYHVGRELLIESRFGIIFKDVSFPNLVERISRLQSTGIPEMLQKYEISFNQRESRSTIHFAAYSNIFESVNCIFAGRNACLKPDLKFEQEKLWNMIAQGRDEAIRKRNLVNRYSSERSIISTYSAVNLYGNISSLFALISILFVLASLSFCFEMAVYRFVTTPSKIVRSKIFVVNISKLVERTITRQAQKFEQWTSSVKSRNCCPIQIS